jgi:hypothetical protein
VGISGFFFALPKLAAYWFRCEEVGVQSLRLFPRGIPPPPAAAIAAGRIGGEEEGDDSCEAAIMGPGLAAHLVRLGVLSSTSDHASVVSINLFVALLCACIVLGHLLEENRWLNESITALVIVSNQDPRKKSFLLDSPAAYSYSARRMLMSVCLLARDRGSAPAL